jgi:hypothetical protein
MNKIINNKNQEFIDGLHEQIKVLTQKLDNTHITSMNLYKKCKEEANKL